MATEAYFKPIETFGERVDTLLIAIQAMGFDALALSMGHVGCAWATRDHIRTAHVLLQLHAMGSAAWRAASA